MIANAKKINGFTLSEILAVIAIIGLIMVVAIPAILGISNSIKKRELETKKEALVAAAELYAKNNASKFKDIGTNVIVKVPVRTLLYYGYVKAESTDEVCNQDKVIGCLVNPVTKISMNSDIVTINKNRSIIQALWGDVENTDSSNFYVIFDLNGADSFVYASGKTNSCTSSTPCEITTPKIIRDGYEIIGYSTNSNASDGIIQPNSLLEIDENNNGVTYYAITRKIPTSNAESYIE